TVLGVVAALCIGVVFMTGFFIIISSIGRAIRGEKIIKAGIGRDGKLINVHLRGVRTLQSVRFLGYQQIGSSKGGVPYPLAVMAAFESPSGNRILVRPDTIMMIEEIESAV